MRKTRLLFFLTLLLTAVTQRAWADQEVTIATNLGQTTYTSGNVTVTFPDDNGGDSDGGRFFDEPWYPMTISVNGGVIKSVVLKIGFFAERAESTHTSGNVGTRTISERPEEGYQNHETWVTFSGINASSVKIYNDDGWVQVEEVKVTYANVVNVTGVSLPLTETMLFTGGTLTLTPTVSPSSATNKSVTWTTSNASVATVANGVVTAVAPGNANITVTTADGGKTATCAVNVIDYSAMSPYVGKVIAADGKIYKTVASANKFSTASGIVAFYGSTVETGQSYQGIAISLTDLRYNPDYMVYCGNSGSCSGSTYGNLATALTVKNGIATNATAYETNADHGYSHQVTFAAGGNSSPRPAGASAWTVPSIGQWNLIMRGLTGSNTNLSTSANAAFSLSSLNAKLPADATGFSQTLYWSNTEKDNTNMWMMQFNGTGGYAGTTAKNTGAVTYCRAMFAFTGVTNAYVVSYDANGGNGAPDAQAKDAGNSLTLSSTVPTLNGFSFTGWNTQADGSGTSYEAGAEYTADDDVMLYAQWAANHDVTFADGITGWTATPASASVGETITLRYNGKKKVKTITVTKDILPATVATVPTATEGTIYAGSTTALVTAGTAAGGTMMYKVTTTNEQPASTDGFTADVPTAASLAAGTCYVWYYVNADADHSDSEIAGPVTVTVVQAYATVATAPTATAGKIYTGSTKALVSAGSATGGTMMYKVTTTNSKPATTDGFSASVPTAEGRAVGTYYVWYYAKGNANYIDSEIAGPVAVTVTATPTLANVFTNGSEVSVKVNCKNTKFWFSATGTYNSGSYTGVSQNSNPSGMGRGISMTKDGDNLVIYMKNPYNEITITFNTTDNTYLVSKTEWSATYDMATLNSITIDGIDITSSLTETFPPAPKITVGDLAGFEAGSGWSDIVSMNEGKIYIDQEEWCVKRCSDGACLMYRNKDDADQSGAVYEWETCEPDNYDYWFDGD